MKINNPTSLAQLLLLVISTGLSTSNLRAQLFSTDVIVDAESIELKGADTDNPSNSEVDSAVIKIGTSLPSGGITIELTEITATIPSTAFVGNVGSAVIWGWAYENPDYNEITNPLAPKLLNQMTLSDDNILTVYDTSGAVAIKLDPENGIYLPEGASMNIGSGIFPLLGSATGSGSVALGHVTNYDEGGYILSEATMTGTTALAGGKASGLNSFAHGAFDYYEEGHWTYISNASGKESVAFSGGKAKQRGSFAMNFSEADGASAFAFGVGSQGENIPLKASGAHSFAFGSGMTEASGSHSFAFGNTNIASGSYSRAFGSLCFATGTNASAFGYFSVASGSYSFAHGDFAVASGENAVAFGWETSASGDYSVALARGYASATGSVALGAVWNDGDIEGSQATGMGSLAVGAGSAHGTGSFAMGLNYGATGNQSFAFQGHAMADDTIAFRGTAQKMQSVAIGKNTLAGADRSVAVGDSTRSYSYGAIAVGINNSYDSTNDNRTQWVEQDPIFVVGNGISSSISDRRNALYLRKNGDMDVAGAVRVWKAGDIDMGSFTSGQQPTTPEVQ